MTTKTKSIAEISALSSGYHFRGGIDGVAGSQYAVIQAKDVDESLHFNPEKLVRVDVKLDSDRYVVRQGDVLFLSRGVRPWALALGHPIDDTIVPSSFYILRADSNRVRPEYVAWFLNHPKTQAILGDIARGSNIPFVSMSEFGRFQIPVPELKTQQRIITLAQLCEREQELVKVLSKRREELVETVCFDLAMGDARLKGEKS
jgi:restriction endonuclease S subunit